MALSNHLKKTIQPQKGQRIPRWKLWADRKVPPFKVQKRQPELCLCEMPEELRAYVLEHPEVLKVFKQPSLGEHDSVSVCYKLEIRSHIKGFNLFEFWYMKQLPVEHSE